MFLTSLPCYACAASIYRYADVLDKAAALYGLRSTARCVLADSRVHALTLEADLDGSLLAVCVQNCTRRRLTPGECSKPREFPAHAPVLYSTAPSRVATDMTIAR